MEMIITIFKSLGVDQTVFIQFVSLIIIFTLVSNLLFKKLKEVLELREKRTVKLEGNAHAVYKKADELAEQYRAHIEKTHQESHLHTQKKKAEALDKEAKIIKETEEKLQKDYEEKRAKLLADFNSHKAKSLEEVDSLSKKLVEKLTH